MDVVLTGGGVHHQPDVMRSAWLGFANHAVDFLQLLHQVESGMQPPGSIDQEDIHILGQPIQFPQYLDLLVSCQPRQLLDSGCGRQDHHVAGAFYDDIGHGFEPQDHMGKVVLGGEPQQHIQISQAEIRIHDEHLPPLPAHAVAQVGHDVGLSHPSFSACYGNHEG